MVSEPGTFDGKNTRDAGRQRDGRTAAQQVYEQAQITPDDIDVIELHDCFAPNE